MKSIFITLLILTSLNLQAQRDNDLIVIRYLAMKERQNYDEAEMLAKLKQTLNDFLVARKVVKEHYSLGNIQPTFRNDKQRQKYIEEYDRVMHMLTSVESTTLQEYLKQYKICERVLYSWYVEFPIYNLNRGYELHFFEYKQIDDYKDLVSKKEWRNENVSKNGTKKSYKVY